MLTHILYAEAPFINAVARARDDRALSRSRHFERAGQRAAATNTHTLENHQLFYAHAMLCIVCSVRRVRVCVFMIRARLLCGFVHVFHWGVRTLSKVYYVGWVSPQ